MVVRGAPASGVSAAYGIAWARFRTRRYGRRVCAGVAAICERLAATRPRLVNLFWAIDA